MIQNLASCIAKKDVSLSWVHQFIRRNKESLVSRWTADIDSNRHQADLKAKYKLYFGLLQQKTEQYRIEPQYTHNMDEKGFLLGVTSRTKRVFSMHLYMGKRVRQAIQDGSREWISLIACICADGSAIDPALIYQATLGDVQLIWVGEMGSQHHTAFIASPSSN